MGQSRALRVALRENGGARTVIVLDRLIVLSTALLALLRFCKLARSLARSIGRPERLGKASTNLAHFVLSAQAERGVMAIKLLSFLPALAEKSSAQVDYEPSPRSAQLEPIKRRR